MEGIRKHSLVEEKCSSKAVKKTGAKHGELNYYLTQVLFGHGSSVYSCIALIKYLPHVAHIVKNSRIYQNTPYLIALRGKSNKISLFATLETLVFITWLVRCH